MAQNEFVVETHGLTKSFGKRTVVRGVELQVPRGVAFGYLGPNGWFVTNSSPGKPGAIPYHKHAVDTAGLAGNLLTAN